MTAEPPTTRHTNDDHPDDSAHSTDHRTEDGAVAATGTGTDTGTGTGPLYLAPDWFTQHVFNRVMAGLTRAGLSMWGSRVLAVPGRTTGEIRTVPVNLLTVDGERYLVAPRGTTQWVRNVRAAGTCELRLGRRVETVRAIEVDDDAKPPILRAYLRRWKWEVKQFFDGIDADSSEEELREIAPGRPVFRLVPA